MFHASGRPLAAQDPAVYRDCLLDEPLARVFLTLRLESTLLVEFVLQIWLRSEASILLCGGRRERGPALVTDGCSGCGFDALFLAVQDGQGGHDDLCDAHD